MPERRKYAVFLILAALAAPVVGCSEDDARDQVDQARKDIREQTREIEGKINDLSEQDLREARRDAEDAVKNGGADAKREARELERKIDRELKQRNAGG